MTKEPIIGGTVKLKGQDTGTVTNMNGEFTINCQVNDVLALAQTGTGKTAAFGLPLLCLLYTSRCG